ncbi:RNA polymerase sigma factor [Marinobacter sp. C2H3]|uniref:RNA polymerase sigma factor n=1 Tax=Marinobacter sp. C2H3 TaxID=3119003 RepID=UPI00300E7800
MPIFSFRQNSTTRFDAIIRPHLEPMYRFAFRLTGNQADAEDLVQDVVIKLFPKLDELARVEQLRPWLNRVLYRQFVDGVRRQHRRGTRTFSELDEQASSLWPDSIADANPGPQDQVGNGRLGSALDRAMAELSPDQRTLVLLHDVDGWRQEDIAAVLDVPIGTIKSRLHRTRAALREKLTALREPDAPLPRVSE